MGRGERWSVRVRIRLKWGPFTVHTINIWEIVNSAVLTMSSVRAVGSSYRQTSMFFTRKIIKNRKQNRNQFEKTIGIKDFNHKNQ